jgi:hypothetical protein
MPEAVPHQPLADPAYTVDGAYPTTAQPPAADVWNPLSISADVPPIAAGNGYDPNIRLAQAPSLGEQSLLLNNEEQAAADSLIPPGARDGVFQKAKFTATYMPQWENDSLGITDLRTSLVFGLPFFTRETPIVIEPEYRVQFLDRPAWAVVDLPSRLNDVSTEFRHFRRLSDRWIFDSAVTVGMYADDSSFDSDDAFRITGRALGVYEATDEWKWIFGVAYLNRAGATVLPIAGLAYDTDTVKYEMVFPRPRAAWLLPGSVVDLDERWAYVMGEFGGGVWAINRPATNTPDTMTMRDIRILFGYERKLVGGVSTKFEVGYVFARELEFASGTPPDVSLDDTILVRAGFSY